MIDAIFIVGSGRTGTHLLCNTLLGYSNVVDFMNGKENHDIRITLTEDALYHYKLNKNVKEYYKKQVNRAKKQGKIFLDQCHTNLFHVEILEKVFPKAIFLFTVRDTEQVVASMLNHTGVKSWPNWARDTILPYPNQFLGIEKLEDLDLPDHILCALRIKAHNKKIKELQKKLGNKFRPVYFDLMIENKEQHIEGIMHDFLEQLGSYKNRVNVDSETLVKYKKVLSKEQIRQIRKVI